MNQQQLRDSFHHLVYPSHANEWEVDDVIENLESLEEAQQQLVLQAIPAVWPISHNLCYSFITESTRRADQLDESSLLEWLRQILSSYEQGGLKKARSYMEDDLFFNPIEQRNKHAALNDHQGRLRSFAEAILGRHIEITPASTIFTDTETIYLHEKVDCFPAVEDNLLWYRVLLSLQCSFLQTGVFNLKNLLRGNPDDLTHNKQIHAVVDDYDNPEVARDIFQLIAILDGADYLQREFPGLMRRAAPLLSQVIQLQRFPVELQDSLPGQIYIELLQFLAANKKISSQIMVGWGEVSTHELLKGYYASIVAKRGGYTPVSFWPLMDRFNYDNLVQAGLHRVEENKNKFETIFAEFLNQQGLASQPDLADKINDGVHGDVAMVLHTMAEGDNENRMMLTIDNDDIALPDEISELAGMIEADLGEMPTGYISAASGKAGRGLSLGPGGDENGEQDKNNFIQYDEWDFRRHGYRKEWCSLRETEMQGVKSDFVAKTLVKYRGSISLIKRRFEMLRTQERFARRRRNGDDIDLDALVDSLGDQRAGLPASENVFVRLMKDTRSISTIFLVDMSNSTEGWVGIAIKEALVLLCEAMGSVGDSYGIYGFSGMRRMRSEVYRIKDIDEKYGDLVHGRIGGISPKEYTRMGPPVRHMIKKFASVDTRTKLLVILSDGKPEDYDDYKGNYAIEDTHKALAEARGNGIHTYGITIDQQQHDYLPRLFGAGNYSFIHNIDLLPTRLTDIYRILTT